MTAAAIDDPHRNAPALAGSRVLVTGASGFIGSRLCPLLARSGADVHGFARGILAQVTGVSRWWTGDVSNEQDVKAVLENVRPDFVFHLAGHVSGLRSIETIVPTFRTNLQGTLNLLLHTTHHDLRRIVLAGSLEEPDFGGPDMTSASPYAASKASASIYSKTFHALYGSPVVVARLFMVYGPGQQDLTKLIPYVALSLLRGETPALSSGVRPVDWVFVDDVIDALISIALCVGLEGSTIDVGSGTLKTVREIVEQLAALIDSNVPLAFGALPDRPLEAVRAADTVRTHERTGWKAAVPIEIGLQRTAAWYRVNVTRLFPSMAPRFSDSR